MAFPPMGKPMGFHATQNDDRIDGDGPVDGEGEGNMYDPETGERIPDEPYRYEERESDYPVAEDSDGDDPMPTGNRFAGTPDPVPFRSGESTEIPSPVGWEGDGAVTERDDEGEQSPVSFVSASDFLSPEPFGMGEMGDASPDEVTAGADAPTETYQPYPFPAIDETPTGFPSPSDAPVEAPKYGSSMSTGEVAGLEEGDADGNPTPMASGWDASAPAMPVPDQMGQQGQLDAETTFPQDWGQAYGQAYGQGPEMPEPMPSQSQPAPSQYAQPQMSSQPQTPPPAGWGQQPQMSAGQVPMGGQPVPYPQQQMGGQPVPYPQQYPQQPYPQQPYPQQTYPQQMPYGAYGQPGMQPYGGAPAGSNTQGIICLVMAIVNIVLFFTPIIWLVNLLLSVVGLVLGIMAIRQPNGKAMAVTGIVIHSLVLAMLVIGILAFLADV